jgi:2,3,4,5-tetrahydropyridine-2-carboxylate N-succinyltransferase
MSTLQSVIEDAWENRTSLSPASAPANIKSAVAEVIAGLDAGSLRVAEKQGGDWVTHQWIKKAVLLSFRLEDNAVIRDGYTNYFDKVAPKFADYGDADFRAGGFRVVPPAAVRKGCFIAKNVVLMPSYVNIGAYVDEGRWSTRGPPSVRAPRSGRTSTCRAASASAACSNPSRRTRPSSRTTASSAPARKWSKA